MAITSYNPAFTGFYAISIYIYGYTSLTAIDPLYYIPVEEYAAQNLSDQEIMNSLTQSYITQQQYDETMSYKTI